MLRAGILFSALRKASSCSRIGFAPPLKAGTHPQSEPEMSQEPVLSTLDQGVLLIELNRPERMNAFTEESHLRLREILARAAEDHAVRAVLLTGRGKAFCAGQDLNNRDPRQPGPRSDLGQSLGRFYNPTIRALRGLQKPVICAMNGAAAGAGVGLALACDIVIAGESAKFVLSFSRLGLVPDAGSSWCLTRILGEARAKALLLTGETIPARARQSWV